jgi:hypothetical protein
MRLFWRAFLIGFKMGDLKLEDLMPSVMQAVLPLKSKQSSLFSQALLRISQLAYATTRSDLWIVFFG